MRGKQETVLNRATGKTISLGGDAIYWTRALVSGGLHSSSTRSGHWIAILEQFANRVAANCAAGLANKPNGRRSFPLTAERTSAGGWRGASHIFMIAEYRLTRCYPSGFMPIIFGPGSFCQAWRSGLCCHGRPTSFVRFGLFQSHRCLCCASLSMTTG